MKKLENFSKYLNALKTADFSLAKNNGIYRTGVIGQFNLTFELAWKALQPALRSHGALEAETGSPRKILQPGFRTEFISDSEAWLPMLKERNLSVHIYDENEADTLALLIKGSFIPAFGPLEKTLKEKLCFSGEL